MAISQEQVEQRAGVEPGYVKRLTDVGLLASASDGDFTEGDARRARIFQALERAGLSLETLAEAVERGRLDFAYLDRHVYDRFAGLSADTFRVVSEREGVPLDLLLILREAMGFAQADPDDQMREDELQVVPVIRLQLEHGFDAAVSERWLRVYGDSLRRITETETEWWRTQISLPQLAAMDMNEVEKQERIAEWGDKFDAYLDRALLAIYHANQEHNWTENLIEEIENALERAGLRERLRTTPAICFLDLAGYTDLVEQQGDQVAAAVAGRLEPLVTRPAERHGGKVVKWLGDGVMLHFADGGGAVSAALEMVDAVADAGLPPAHVGIHTGPVVFQGGDYFGRTVNIAARIMGQAEAGQVLVSDDVARSIEDDGFIFDPIGPVELKGVVQPISLHEVRLRT